VPIIHRQELARLIAKNEPELLMVVDVSEREEPSAKTPVIPGSVCIPLGELIRNASMDDEFRAKIRGKTVVTCC
jgi:hypothetical protein